MTEIDKAEVYRKAAEVIVRDGKTEGVLFGAECQQSYGAMIENRSLPVCAIGACVRAEYELYGTVHWSRGVDAYNAYEFEVEEFGDRKIWSVSDDGEWTSDLTFNATRTAEDIALLLKRHAEDIADG